MAFTNINDACLHVLGKYCSLINSTGLEYVVIGGWSPYLNNSGLIKHPGTRDVDVLFRDGVKEGSLKDLIKKSVSNGYLISAKHPFQLFEILKVDSYEFVFNIDLMHPNEGKMEVNFVEQFDLGVFIDKERIRTIRAKSINGPISDILFEPLCCDKKVIVYTNDERKEEQANIYLINELGCILSKAISCSKSKRERDSFDIFISIKQARDYKALIDSVIKLKKQGAEEYQAIKQLIKAHQNGVLLKNINEIIKISDNEYIDTMDKFINDIK